jgi:hypothetical protein
LKNLSTLDVTRMINIFSRMRENLWCFEKGGYVTKHRFSEEKTTLYIHAVTRYVTVSLNGKYWA